MTDKWTVHDFDQAPERSPRLPWRRPSLIQRTPRERKSFNGALVVSVLLHVLLLSQLVGGDGQGLSGFVLPWQERRAVVPDVQVVLTPLPAAPPVEPADPASAVPVQRASIRSAPVRLPAPTPPAAPPAPRPQAPAVAEAPQPAPVAPPKEPAAVAPQAVADATPVNAAPPRPAVPDRALPPPPPSPAPAVLTAEPSEVPAPVVPVAPETPTLANAVDPSASSPDPAALAAREAALEAQRQEAARAETARLEAERQVAARQAAAQLEAQRQEAVRQATARAEAARLEAERQEAARQAAAAQLEAQQRQEAARQAAARAEAARLEAVRQEAARQAAAQLEAQRQDAARQAAARAEAARLETERADAARKAAAQQEAARVQAAQEAAAKREAVLRAIGRQLDEENARRDAAANASRPSSALPLSLSTARRARLWGHTDPNADLVAYAQAWALKIQLNTLPDRVREITKRPHTPPTVTVALRSDGSVESMTFVVSSGVAEVDDAIRRIVETQRPYPAFPPALAREFDVIEIRRTWYFDAAVRLH
ncbi:TonB C-terminal domain-containing protein [Sphaerotilus sp.]|uniref:TonB C-terminal domain-containing protein n=1 Tax=Sphaerotilus sp. TaxID=2093942 RepID=UPI0034E2052E